MKRLIFIIGILIALFLYLFFYLTKNIESNQNDIDGLWKGYYNGQEIIFRFEKDNKCIINVTDTSTGKIAIINGIFQLDLSKNPIPLTLHNIPQFNHPLYTIMEFLANDSIKVARFSPRWRLCPITFNNTTTYYLKRIK